MALAASDFLQDRCNHFGLDFTNACVFHQAISPHIRHYIRDDTGLALGIVVEDFLRPQLVVPVMVFERGKLGQHRFFNYLTSAIAK